MGFEIIIISPPDQEESEKGVLLDLFKSGLNTFHLRKPHWPSDALEAYIHSIPEIYHARLVIHSHYALAAKYKLKGIHLTESSKKDQAAIAQLKSWQGLRLSASFHSLEELNRHRRKYAYVWLSPIFDSISKADYKSRFDLKMIEQRLQLWHTRKSYVPQVVALGGINADNIGQIQQTGFAGAALLGSIWQSQNPVQEWLKLQSKVS